MIYTLALAKADPKCHAKTLGGVSTAIKISYDLRIGQGHRRDHAAIIPNFSTVISSSLTSAGGIMRLLNDVFHSITFDLR